MTAPTTMHTVPVLMYHRIGRAEGAWESRYCVSPRRFASHMEALQRAGWRPCTLPAFAEWLEGGDLPPRSVLITFDDGFLGLHEHALPVLAQRGWPFALFVVTALVGKRDEWSATENPTGRTYPLLDWHHLDELQRHGAWLASHSRRHRDLTSIDDASLTDELAGSRRDLEDRLGRPVAEVAYPYGRHDERVVAATRAAGYRLGFSVRAGVNTEGIDRMQIRRLDVYGTDSAGALLRKLHLGSNDGSLVRMWRYYAGRLGARLGAEAGR